MRCPSTRLRIGLASRISKWLPTLEARENPGRRISVVDRIIRQVRFSGPVDHDAQAGWPARSGLAAGGGFCPGTPSASRVSLERMTLARAGIAVAVAGGVALAIHADLYAKQARQARQQSDCAAWRRAGRTILSRWDRDIWGGWLLPVPHDIVATALQAPDMSALWQARAMVAYHPELVWALLPALRDPTFLGLRNAGDVSVVGRHTPFPGQRRIEDDLFSRAGRASWLLKEVTGRSAPSVRVQTDPAFLADLARDWKKWLDGLDGGAVCWLPP